MAKKKVSKKSAPKTAIRSHGGHSFEGRRKTKRPLEVGKPTHVVLSSTAAKGRLSFSAAANQKAVNEIVGDRASQFGIKVLHVQAKGTRLHLVVSFKDSAKFQGFLRTITAMIARTITGAKKGNPFGRKFWDHIAYTKTVESSESPNDFTTTIESFERNER